jgi:drug/metabolite transporter (DMT)-like permease
MKLRWYYLFGAIFLVLGVYLLFTHRWIEGAWAITLGASHVVYGYRHPKTGRRDWNRAEVIQEAIHWLVIVAIIALLWLVILAILTLLGTGVR